MKLSSVATVALLSGVSLAVPRGCEPPKTMTVYSTIHHTHTENAAAAASSSSSSNQDSRIDSWRGISNSGSSNSNFNSNSNFQANSNYQANSNAVNAALNKGALVNQYDIGSDGRQTVRSCPTGMTNYDCIEAVYDKSGVTVSVHMITITVTTNSKGEVSTATVTKGDRPQVTPMAKLVDINGNSGDQVVTVTTDVTATSTLTSTARDGKKITITKTHTHHTKLIATGKAAPNAKPTHKVHVGKDGRLEFEPKTIKAKAGDVVRFTFYPKNHSVTTCHEHDPCVENNVFDSGYKFTFIKNSTTFIEYPVTDENKPVFFFRYASLSPHLF